MGGQRAAIAFGYGCSRAMVDAAALFDYVDANGWLLTDSLETADLILLSTCAFDRGTEEASERILGATRRRARDDARIVIVGCAGSIMSERLAQLDMIGVPPRTFHELDDIIDADVPLAQIPDPPSVDGRIREASAHFSNEERHEDDALLVRGLRRAVRRVRLRDRMAAHGLTAGDSYLQPTERVHTLRVGRGCRGSCSYCIIRFAKEAELTSKPLADVLAEFDAGLDQGARDFKLVAQDLGAYGQDCGSTVAELLGSLLEREGDFRLTIADLGARWFVRYADDILETLSEHADKVRYLSVPVQTGSDRLLASMRRGHTVAELEAPLRELRERAPGIHLSTQVMIGFPGETGEDFAETRRFLRSVGFDRVDIFDFSARQGTDAADMPDVVPPRVLRSRSRRLRTEFAGRAAGLEYAAREWVKRANRRRSAAREPATSGRGA